jgi:GTP:adenosylcobinamide-phosphate guanylyltransferase
VTERFTALVLAARRDGVDPVAAAGQCSHKGLVPMGGQAMLARVLSALVASRSVGALAISIDDPAALMAAPDIAALIEAHDIALIDSAESPSLSVAQAIDSLAQPWPVLVTTSDVPLLRAEMVDHFCSQARQSKADIAVGLASDTVVFEAYPDAQRTFLRFRGGRYTGCNLFAAMTPRSLDAVAFWRRIEQDRKHPWRLFKGFGALAIMRFLAGGATLEAGFAAASRRLGLTAAAVAMPFADAAIDVDTPAHMKLVENIIRTRGDI